MKQLNIQDIRSLDPCYDPIKYLLETWQGTVIDILKMSKVPASDRLWVVVRHEFLNYQILHRYGLACARQCEKYSTDIRVKQCNDTVEAYLSGHATKEELSAARFAAESAARSAARFAAESAARSAGYAAESAAESAGYAAWSAGTAAGYAARLAAQEEQCLILIDLIERYS